MKRQDANDFVQKSDEGQVSSIVNFTNEILVNDQVEQKGCKIYYIPVYLRAELKNIIEMDFQKLMAKVNVDLILSVYLGTLDGDDVKHLQKKMALIFPRDPPVYLQEEPKIVSVNKSKDNCLQYTVGKVIEVQILNNIRFAPFETAHIIISANMRKTKRFVEAKNGTKQHWVKYKFNFMDVQGDEFHDLKFSLGTERRFGFYNIAQKQMQVVFDNKYQNPKDKEFLDMMKEKVKGHEKPKTQTEIVMNNEPWYSRIFNRGAQVQQVQRLQQDEFINDSYQNQQDSNINKLNKKIDSFQYAYFIVPLYKSPYSMTALVLLQLLLIGTVNVCIFYQDMTLSGKQMLNMAALMVSLVGILPNIRESMGRSSQITLAEMCTIFQTLTVIFTFIHMIQNVNIEQSQRTNYVLGSQGLAIACIIITGLISLVLLGFLIVHTFFWRKGYHFHNKKHQVKWFERRFWKNTRCDREFRQSLDYNNGKVCMLRPFIDAKKN